MSNTIKAMERIEEYLQWAMRLEGDRIYRGLADKSWKVSSSSLERKLGEGVKFSVMLKETEKMLGEINNEERVIEGGKILSDLEVLARRQHHVTKTFLIDFTNSPLIALWFACKDSGVDGKVISIDASDDEELAEVSEDIEEKISFFSGEDKLYKFTPSVDLTERIATQNSVFIFGAKGIADGICKEFLIKKEEKEGILTVLEEKLGAHEGTVFPDPAARARFRSSVYGSVGESPFDISRQTSNQGEIDNAINGYNEDIKSGNGNFDTYNYRGVAYVKKGQYDKAIQDFSKAIELQPNHPTAYNNRGLVYTIKKEYFRALADFGKAIELAPGNASLYHHRGVTYDNVQKYNHAIADFSKVVELEPNSPSAYMGRGNAYFSTEKYDHAITDFSKVIELAPNHVPAYAARAAAYNNKKEYDLAINDYNKALDLDPNNANEHNNRGVVYFLLGKYEKALEDFNRAIDLNPYNAGAYYNRGDAKRKLGDEKGAQEDFAIARALGFQFPPEQK